MSAPKHANRPTRAASLGYAATDALTAVIFLWTWIAPGSMFFADVASMELVYVVEFMSLHAAGMLAGFIVSDRMHVSLRVFGIVVLGGLYVAFFVRLGTQADIWWPAAVMAMFIYGKIGHALFRPRGPDHRFHFGLQWGGSTALFVLLTGLAFALPWPHLGIAPSPDEGRVLADGATEAPAHTLVVAGALYFSILALIKYRFAGYFLAHSTQR